MAQGDTQFNTHLRNWNSELSHSAVDYFSEYDKRGMLYDSISDQLKSDLRLTPWNSMSYDEFIALLVKLDRGRHMEGLS